MKQQICYGTVWTEGRLQPPSQPLAPGEELQFARRGLDASFLGNLYIILLGVTYTEIAAAFKAGHSAEIESGVKRIGGAQLAPYHTAHFYECSATFRARMAPLTADRIKDVADHWYALQRDAKTPSSSSSESAQRKDYRREIIQNLAALAKVAEERDSRILLRAEYRMME
jgi:hypothetical protein